MKEIINCFNTLRGVGFISECKIDFIIKESNIMIKGSIVIRIKDKYIRCNIFTNKKMRKQYYDCIESFGIPFSFFEGYDTEKYTIYESIPHVEMSGKINLIVDDIIVNSIDLPKSDNKDKIFVIGNITEYGWNLKYLSRTKETEILDCNMQGIIKSIGKENNIVEILLTSKKEYSKIIKFRYDTLIKDKILNHEKCHIYNFLLSYDSGFNVVDNVIYGDKFGMFIIKDMVVTDNFYEYEDVKGMVDEIDFIKQLKGENNDKKIRNNSDKRKVKFYLCN